MSLQQVATVASIPLSMGAGTSLFTMSMATIFQHRFMYRTPPYVWVRWLRRFMRKLAIPLYVATMVAEIVARFDLWSIVLWFCLTGIAILTVAVNRASDDDDDDDNPWRKIRKRAKKWLRDRLAQRPRIRVPVPTPT